MTIAETTDWRQWYFSCTHCDHTFRTAARTRADAESTARTNGWALHPTVLCAACITARAHSNRQAGSTMGVA